MVSKASEDWPEAERPVNTTRRSRGSSRVTSLRLCSGAPLITILLEDSLGASRVYPEAPLRNPRLQEGLIQAGTACPNPNAAHDDLAARPIAVGGARSRDGGGAEINDPLRVAQSLTVRCYVRRGHPLPVRKTHAG